MRQNAGPTDSQCGADEAGAAAEEVGAFLRGKSEKAADLFQLRLLRLGLQPLKPQWSDPLHGAAPAA